MTSARKRRKKTKRVQACAAQAAHAFALLKAAAQLGQQAAALLDQQLRAMFTPPLLHFCPTCQVDVWTNPDTVVSYCGWTSYANERAYRITCDCGARSLIYIGIAQWNGFTADERLAVTRKLQASL